MLLGLASLSRSVESLANFFQTNIGGAMPVFRAGGSPILRCPGWETIDVWLALSVNY